MSRTHTLSLIKFELVRVFLSARWLIALLVWLLVAKLGARSVQVFGYGTGTSTWSVFDVHATAINSSFNVGLLLLTTFVFVACDGIARDCESRYVHMVLPRTSDRRSWWLAKVTAIVVSALVFQLGFLAACVAVGWSEGASISTAPSEVARLVLSASQGQAQMLFAPVASTANMLVRELVRSAYLVLTFSVAGGLFALPTIRFAFSWLPSGLALAAVMSDWIANFFLPAWFRHFGLVGRMLEGVHSPAMASPALSWWSSITVFGVLALGVVVAGTLLVARVDI